MTLPQELQLESPFTVRIFTLADHAVQPPDGKLYMHGAGVARMALRAIPGPLGPLFLVVRVHVAQYLALQAIPMRIRGLDPDEQPVGPDPLLQGNVEVARAPGMGVDDELAFSVIVPLVGLPIRQAGMIYFHLDLLDQTVGTLPLRLVKGPPLPTLPGPPPGFRPTAS